MMSKEKTLSILCTILRIAFSIFAIIKSDFRIEINGHWHLQDNKSFAIIALWFSLCCNIFHPECLMPNYVFWKWSFEWDANLGKIMIWSNKSNYVLNHIIVKLCSPCYQGKFVDKHNSRWIVFSISFVLNIKLLLLFILWLHGIQAGNIMVTILNKQTQNFVFANV